MALSKHFKRSNLAQKILNYMHGLKSAILTIFQNGTGMAVPCKCGPQEFLTGIQKFILFSVPIIPYKDWKVKLERVHFSMFQSGKITVWLHMYKNVISERMSSHHCSTCEGKTCKIQDILDGSLCSVLYLPFQEKVRIK